MPEPVEEALAGKADDPPLLAICIPTHTGRAATLDRLLGMLWEQIEDEPEVEICVSDNATRDATPAVLARHRRRFGERLVVRRQAQEVPVAANVLDVVAMARGARFCWLLGSDDGVVPDAVAQTLALLRAHPDVSGVSMGVLRVNRADLRMPDLQLPVEAVPAEREPTLFTSHDAWLDALGLLPFALCVLVVHRARWLRAAERMTSVIGRCPDYPQLAIVGDMAAADPRWLWYPRQLVLSGAGTFYLAEGEMEGADTTRQLRRMTRQVDDVWAAHHGRLSSRHRRLMHRWYRITASPASLLNQKLMPGTGFRQDIRQLRTSTRAFWWNAEFRRTSLPVLLVPAPAARRAPAPRLPVDECRARVEVTGPERWYAGYQHELVCRVEHQGTRPWPGLGARPVRVGARWFDPDTRAAKADPRRAVWLAPLRPGRVRTLRMRVDAPVEPGDYVLRVALVQESVRWWDDADPSTGWEARVRVESVPRGTDRPPVWQSPLLWATR